LRYFVAFGNVFNSWTYPRYHIKEHNKVHEHCKPAIICQYVKNPQVGEVSSTTLLLGEQGYPYPAQPKNRATINQYKKQSFNQEIPYSP